MPYARNQRGRGSQPQQPKPEPTTVKAIVGAISETLTDFMVRIKVEARRGNMRVDGTVSIVEGIDTIDSLRLNNGDGFYNITESFSSAGTTRTLTFVLDGPQDIRDNAVIKFPEREAKKKATKPDPDQLQITRHRMADGANTIFARVVDALGNGIKTVVQVCAQGVIYDLPTDKNGTAVWPFPRCLNPRETVDADICVTGIVEKAKVILRGPRPNHAGRPAAWTWGWWYGTNNGRGVALLIAMVAIWIIALVIGPGDPLISFGHTELSAQEKFYNAGADIYKATVDQAPGLLHAVGNAVCKFVWLFLAPLLTIFAILYFVFSLREEIAEGIIEGLELLVDRPYVRSKDPLAERIMAWSGVYATAKKAGLVRQPLQAPETEEKTEETKTEQPKGRGHVSFWELFRSDLASDLLVVVLPQVIRHYFR